MIVRFASAVLESLSFPVYDYEWVCVLLIFHDISPLTWILLFGARTERCEAERVAVGEAVTIYNFVNDQDRRTSFVPNSDNIADR
jgi:hypothetical protein